MPGVAGRAGHSEGAAAGTSHGSTPVEKSVVSLAQPAPRSTAAARSGAARRATFTGLTYGRLQYRGSRAPVESWVWRPS